MKRFWLGFALGIVFTIAVAAVGYFVIMPRIVAPAVGVRNGRPFPPNPQEAVGGDLRVALGGEHGDAVVFTRASETFRYTPPSGEFCECPVSTPDGRTAFVLVHTEGQHGYDYGCILRFDFGSAPLASTQPQRILTSAQLEALFGGKRSWVNALHKVTADGNQLLLNISSERTPASDTYTTYYDDHPYWYDIASNKLNEPNA